MDDLTQRIANVIKEQIGAESVHPTDDLVNDLHLDSLDIVELVMSLEEEFGIEIPDEEAFGHSKESIKFRTAEEWAGYIRSKKDDRTKA